MRKLKISKFIENSLAMSVIFNGLRLQKAINLKLKRHDVNLNQSLILLSIFFEPNQNTRSMELTNLTPMSKGNLSHCLSFLEEKKFIQRKLIHEDLRGFEFSLTVKGKNLCINLIKIFDQVESESDKIINSKKRDEMMQVLNHLNTHKSSK